MIDAVHTMATGYCINHTMARGYCINNTIAKR
jgi:hypothetical protein